MLISHKRFAEWALSENLRDYFSFMAQFTRAISRSLVKDRIYSHERDLDLSCDRDFESTTVMLEIKSKKLICTICKQRANIAIFSCRLIFRGTLRIREAYTRAISNFADLRPGIGPPQTIRASARNLRLGPLNSH